MAGAVPSQPTPGLAGQDDYQAAYNAGGSFKERLEAISKSWRVKEPERVSVKERPVERVEEIPAQPEVGPEVEEYVEKVEKEPLPAGLADDYVKTVGMQPANPQTVSVKLPLTSSQVQQGLHHKVWEAVRWLAIWCLRQMKMVSWKRA